MKLPNYTLRELLIGIALISVGLALANISGFRLYMASGVAIGAGIGTILRRRLVGAMLGLVAAVVVFGW